MPPPAVQLGERRTSRWIAAALLVLVFAASLVGSEFRPGVLFGGGARERAGDFFREWWPPRLDGPFLERVLTGAVDTVAIAVVGTACAAVVGFPLGVLGSRIVTEGALFAQDRPRRSSRAARLVYLLARAVGGFFRSIPEVLWAVLFVRVFGLGPAPAVAAFAVAYGGMLGKVYSEQLEEAAPEPVAALESVGASRGAVLAWAILPQTIGRMASYTAYRFECAVRASALMGFVGAGGLGFLIEISVGDYLWNEVLTEVVVLVLVVLVIELLSDAAHRWIG